MRHKALFLFLHILISNINIEKAVNTIIFTLRGYSESQASPQKRIEDYSNEQERYIREIDEYITLLRRAFYKEEKYEICLWL